MKIGINNTNCDFDNYYLIEESADSIIEITLELKKIVSVQSKKKSKEKIIHLIQSELHKYKWIISGSVLVDFVWYLDSVEKQETDKIGDIDNISKPIQDSLIGLNGILIDDSQIGGLYSFWMTRNDLIAENILKIKIRFNNDYCLLKKNLHFIQYNGAICMPININFDNLKNLLGIKMLLAYKDKFRSIAKLSKLQGPNIDKYLLVSEWDFHRSRLNAFNSRILQLEEFNSICLENGLDENTIQTMMERASS